MLSASLFEQRLRELGSLEEIYLSGGEPFEHPALAQMVRSASAVASSVILYTSGLQIGAAGNEPLPLESLRAVSRAGASRVDVSLYGARAEEHDTVTLTSGSFELTLETLRRLRAERTPFGLHTVLLGPTCDVLPIAELARDLGAARLHVLSLAPQGRGRSLEPVTLSAGTLEGLHRLRREPMGVPLVLSSGVRHALGIFEPTARDRLRAAMLDVHGFLYPGEGRRLPVLRSRSSIADRRLRDLLADMPSI